MKHDLIVFGEDWGGLPSSTQHLIKQLSYNRQIIWVNSIGLRQPKCSIHDIKRVWKKITQATVEINGDTDIAPFKTVNLKTIPAPKGSIARWIAKRLITKQLKPILKKANLHQPILWTSLPTVADLCGSLNETQVVYYCGDDFSALAGVDHDVVLKHENKLVKKADLILVASETLFAKFPQEKTQYLPHGVDYTLFHQTTPRANDLFNDGKPIAGFYGSLSHWLDYDLLNQVIAKNPDWHFVFIGQNELGFNPFDDHNNLSLLGTKPHHQLSRYSQHWQVSLLPFVDNEQIRACNPLKLLEYLATGTPIISTPFPALAPYKSTIHTVNSVNEFSQQLHTIKLQWKEENNNITSLDARRRKEQQAALIKNHTWQARAMQLDAWLEAL